MQIGINEVEQGVLTGRSIHRSDVPALLDVLQRQPWELLHCAHRIRRGKFGNKVRLCSIVPGKLGNCSEDCKWCAQSSLSSPGVISPRRTSLEEIRTAAREAHQMGSSYIGLVNSGLRPSRRDLDDTLAAAEAIHRDLGGAIRVCASLGELTNLDAGRLADSTVVRYHHNLETSRGLFPKMVTTHSYDGKLRTLQAAKDAGMSICCGGLFGLGENWSDRMELGFTIREEIHPDVVPLNFLCPLPGTPLESASPLQPLEILQIIALFRLIFPDVDLKVAGGRETNLKDMQSWIFYAGATSCMIGNYLTTAGRSPKEDLQMIRELGLDIVSELSPKSQEERTFSANPAF